MESRLRVAGWGGCAALVAAATALRIVAAQGVSAPWIAPDEPTYGLLGRSLWHSGRFLILGATAPFYGVVYPALAGLPLTLFGTATGIDVLQGLQALLMCSTAFLVYGWGRRLVRPELALVAAALTVALPALAYSGLIMTEAAYYPVATLALFAIAWSLEEPELERQALAVCAILLASLTRLQGLVLLPVLVTAVLLAALLARDMAVLRRYGPTLTLLVVAAAILLAFHTASGSGDVLGAYTTTTQGSYHAGPVLRWTLRHAGDAFLLVGGIPLLATLTLAIDALVSGDRSPRARALLALAAAYVAWSVAQVGAFASRFAGVLVERNLISVAPILFLGFALWLERGLPRPRVAVALAAGLAFLPALALSASQLADPAASPNSFSALAFVHLRDWVSAGAVRGVWLGAAALATALFLALPRRLGRALPALVLVLLVGGSALASADVHRLSGDLRRQLIGAGPPNWVDRAADGPVAYVYAGSAYWNGVWLSVFWNHRIDRVVTLPVPASGPLPPHDTVSPRFDGRLFTRAATEVQEPYVLASSRLQFVGTPVRSVAQATDLGSLTLWRIRPPLRVTTYTTGVQPNGDIVGRAQVDVFSCGPGRLELTLLGKAGTPVELSVDGARQSTISVRPGTARSVVVPTPGFVRGGTRCSFGIDSPGLIGTTRIAFVPDGP